MTHLTLDEAKNKGLPDLLKQGASEKEIVISGDGVKYHVHVTVEKITQRTKRIAGLGAAHPSEMSDDFNDEDPRINALFYGKA